MGPITIDLAKLPDEEEAFSERTSILFKETRVVRLVDRARRTLVYLAYSTKLPQQTELIVPFFKSSAIPLGTVGFMILGYFVVVGTSNAVNLTDGLDLAVPAFGPVALDDVK